MHKKGVNTNNISSTLSNIVRFFIFVRGIFAVTDLEK